ncbi:MAG TPA: DNA-directed RNA polymerase subunit omega [Verrucomicrobiae bacterium]|nr:DNA-directed RNA polymerase subunit omega [Verrucomicrobiae bacterium]
MTRKALEKVGNPNVLVNLVSRRVRQLNGLSGGSPARPLISETVGLGMADIALLEIAEGKVGWDLLDDEGQVRDGEDSKEKAKESKSSKHSK